MLVNMVFPLPNENDAAAAGGGQCIGRAPLQPLTLAFLALVFSVRRYKHARGRMTVSGKQSVRYTRTFEVLAALRHLASLSDIMMTANKSCSFGL